MRPLLKPISVVLLVVFLISVGGHADAAPEKARVLIVTGFDVGSHQWEESTKLVDAILKKSGRFDVTISTDKEVFASPKLSDYETVVLSYGFWQESDPSEKAKAGLLNYVTNGGNIVALFSPDGRLVEFAPNGDIVWQLEANKNVVVGRLTYSDTLRP